MSLPPTKFPVIWPIAGENHDEEDRLHDVGVAGRLLRRARPRDRLAVGRRRTGHALQRMARRGRRVPGRARDLGTDGGLLAHRRRRRPGRPLAQHPLDPVRRHLAGHAQDRLLPDADRSGLEHQRRARGGPRRRRVPQTAARWRPGGGRRRSRRHVPAARPDRRVPDLRPPGHPRPRQAAVPAPGPHVDLRLASTRTFGNGVVLLHYKLRYKLHYNRPATSLAP